MKKNYYFWPMTRLVISAVVIYSLFFVIKTPSAIGSMILALIIAWLLITFSGGLGQYTGRSGMMQSASMIDAPTLP